MAKSPLEGSLAKTIGKAMSSLFLPAELIYDTAGSGPAYNPGPSTQTTTPCRAIVEQWSAYEKSQNLVAVQDRRVLVLAASLAIEPKDGMRITIQGGTYRIYSDNKGQPGVSTDPATAVWVLRCKT